MPKTGTETTCVEQGSLVGDRRWLQIVLLLVLFTAPGWLSALGLERQGPQPTAAESQTIGWQDPISTGHIARDIFDRVNAERRARGAPAVVWHEGLAELARRWSVHMIEQGAYGHSPDEFRAHPEFVGTGENILMGYRGAQDAHVGWMRSDGHRANIIDADFDAVGIGVVCRNDGSMWATEIFGVSRMATPGHPPVSTAADPIVADGRGPLCPIQDRPLY